MRRASPDAREHSESPAVPRAAGRGNRPRLPPKREPEPVEMGHGLPDDAIGYGLPVMEKVRPMRAPEAYDLHKHEKREKNYGADISTLIRMIEAGEL